MSGKYTQTPGGVFVPGKEYASKAQYTYESAELFLSMVQAEYQNEIDRSAALDSKLGISLPLISGYFFLIIQETDIDSLWNFTPDVGSSLTERFMSLLYLITVVTAVISLCLMILAVLTRKYETVDMKQFCTADLLSKSKEEFSMGMTEFYMNAIDLNHPTNEKKALEYQWGWATGIISLFCFFLYASIA